MTTISSHRFIPGEDGDMYSVVPQVITASFRNYPSIDAATVTEEVPP
jgi:hypothetical protein